MLASKHQTIEDAIGNKALVKLGDLVGDNQQNTLKTSEEPLAQIAPAEEIRRNIGATDDVGNAFMTQPKPGARPADELD